MEHVTADQELVERVQKKLDENLERAKTISNQIRSRGQHDIKYGNEFVGFFEKAQHELDKAIEFVQKLEENPLLVFTESHLYLQSTKGASFLLLNSWNRKEKEIRGHHFQTYLAHYANLYLQTWLKEKGIDKPFHIAVRNQMQFPSIFALYHDDMEIVQFNVLEQWYGIRKRPLTEEELQENHQKELQRIQKEIEEQEERIQKEIDRRDHPLKHYKGFKNVVAYLFISKKKLYQALDRFVEKEKSILEQFMEDKVYAELYYPIRLEQELKNLRHVEIIEPFFKELQYELCTDKYKLY